MTLKEQIPADFNSTFLNEEEFARTCDWNGKPLRIVESAVANTEKSEATGIATKRVQVICKAEDLKAPAPMEEISLDGKEWYVFDVQKPIGHLIIVLERRAA
jgi:hypothetical protein